MRALDRDAERRRRLIENERLFRGENRNRLEELRSAAVIPEVRPLGFVCECSRLDCLERVELTLAEYESVHTHPRRFTIRHGHEELEVEQVVLTTDRYVVVEKFKTPNDEGS